MTENANPIGRAASDCLREISESLATFSLDVPDNEIARTLDDLFSGHDALGERERDQALRQISDLLNTDPRVLIHVLLSERFEKLRRTEPFAIAVAYAYFLLALLDESWWICERLMAGGCRRPFLVDLAVRLLIEMDRLEAAQALLAENRDLLDHFSPLIGRAAALLFIEGRIDEANELCRGAHSAYRTEMRKKVNVRMDDILLMSKSERAAFDQEVTDAYSNPDNQLAGWRQYQIEMGEDKSRYRNDSCFFNDVFRRAFEEAMAADPAIRTVVNYGSLYGYIDWVMARSHPDRTFVGYDRAPVARTLNEQEFQAPNLHFRDGDFAEALRPFAGEGGTLLGHCRTGTLIYPEDLERFYRACRDLGVTHIIAAEIVNYGEADGEYPDFAHSNRSSKLLGGHMIHHDYARYLGRAGYRITRRSLNPTTCHRPYRVHGKVFYEMLEVLQAELVA